MNAGEVAQAANCTCFVHDGGRGPAVCAGQGYRVPTRLERADHVARLHNRTHKLLPGSNRGDHDRECNKISYKCVGRCSKKSEPEADACSACKKSVRVPGGENRGGPACAGRRVRVNRCALLLAGNERSSKVQRLFELRPVLELAHRAHAARGGRAVRAHREHALVRRARRERVRVHGRRGRYVCVRGGERRAGGQRRVGAGEDVCVRRGRGRRGDVPRGERRGVERRGGRGELGLDRVLARARGEMWGRACAAREDEGRGALARRLVCVVCVPRVRVRADPPVGPAPKEPCEAAAHAVWFRALACACALDGEGAAEEGEAGERLLAREEDGGEGGEEDDGGEGDDEGDEARGGAVDLGEARGAALCGVSRAGCAGRGGAPAERPGRPGGYPAGLGGRGDSLGVGSRRRGVRRSCQTGELRTVQQRRSGRARTTCRVSGVSLRVSHVRGPALLGPRLNGRRWRRAKRALAQREAAEDRQAAASGEPLDENVHLAPRANATSRAHNQRMSQPPSFRTYNANAARAWCPGPAVCCILSLNGWALGAGSISAHHDHSTGSTNNFAEMKRVARQRYRCQPAE
ncbi:hypothetical protein OBBRIDRAFT_803859 [Obba rivulosa]|uniref:Uncharacterized protein n=1 Tax=Obba rivulosa TaxID=1052685 RepID=A0A8E2DKP1_9APHY|nr:hypothetical protein OBBRIDRAFT_803859 [Obba rivulosa]